MTEEEILRYLQEFLVESFIIFSQDVNNLFNIDLFQLNEPGIFFKSKTYRRIRYVLNMEEDFFEVIPHISTWYNRVRVDYIMKYYNQFYCDIVTSYDIVKHLRKECDIIPHFNKKFVQLNIDNINGILRLITFDKYSNIITTTDLLDREYELYLTKLYKYTSDNL